MAISKVLLVAGSANFSTREVWEGYRIALSYQGIEVIPYPTFSLLKVLSPDGVCSDLIGTALDCDQQIDCVVFIDGLYFRGKRARVPRSILAAGTPTVLIATDDPYEEIPQAELIYRVRFSNELTCAGDGVQYLPTASLEFPELPRLENPKYALSFVGTVFEDRVPFLVHFAEHCEQQRLPFLIAGKFVAGYDELSKFQMATLRPGTIGFAEKCEIYANSKVVLNLFRGSETAQSPNPRVFEVTAFGHAALLSGPKRSEVRSIFGESVAEFETPDKGIRLFDTLVTDSETRISNVVRAKEITTSGHLYVDRAAQLIKNLREQLADARVAETNEHRLAWIIGSGRTGSTWLAEMLGDLPGIRRWHEPYFGRFLKHVQDRPEELDRNASFFSRKYLRTWLDGLRKLFYGMVQDRYPDFGRHALVVKEVNTPELFGWIHSLFPTGQLIYLVRDPFDTLDSYFDMQKPGSWNSHFGDGDDPLTEANVRRTASHIRNAMEAAASAYDRFPSTQRLRLSYEELLAAPVQSLQKCCELLSVERTDSEIEEVVKKHDFQNYSKTGKLQFRRSGRSGVWRNSENFRDPKVLGIADEILGPIRRIHGYEDQ
ncbi:Sulfotransferase domain protein [Thalassoglobus neptunius]|uniref:Sulfotransferase domain protein n=1 Tax=Thalassoglobus neptunius TaxID=1938619 RepID=A0A5C5X6Y9_9PLAN|nr:sulfotransferase [Thalassoglobus neptunius]TWT58023.1 Sulfotransferase domain protein [Thalassoglobus neptunius]